MSDKDRIWLLRAALYDAKHKLFEASGAVRAMKHEAHADEFLRAAQAAGKVLDEDVRVEARALQRREP